MSVKVELEFKSVDEAIVALGKLVVAAPGNSAGRVAVPSAKPEPLVTGSNPVSASATTTGPKRGRGRPPKDATGASAAPVQGAAVVGSVATPTGTAGNGTGATTDPSSTAKTSAGASTSTTASAPQVAAPSATGTNAPVAPAATPTADDVQKAVEVLFTAKGYDTTLALLKGKYGVSRGKDVDPEQRAAFIREANEAAKL